jgi:hypothetical protein
MIWGSLNHQPEQLRIQKTQFTTIKEVTTRQRRRLMAAKVQSSGRGTIDSLLKDRFINSRLSSIPVRLYLVYRGEVGGRLINSSTIK